jgi:hypothetical protein
VHCYNILEEYCYFEIQIHEALCEFAVEKGYCILFAGYTNSGTFIGPPRLERETRIRESPVRVPTGTTTVPGSVRIADWL